MIALPGTPIILYHMVTYHKYRNTWRWKIGFSDTAFHHSHPFHHHPYYWHHQHHHDDHQSPSVITIKSIITIITNLQFFIQDGGFEDEAILYAAACDRCSSDCAKIIIMLCVCNASDFYAACPVVTEITCGFLKYVVSLILLGVGLSQSNTGSAVRWLVLCWWSRGCEGCRPEWGRCEHEGWRW